MPNGDGRRERLIDVYLPHYDVVERHATSVRAAAAATWSAIRVADLAANPLVRTLLALRAAPAALARGLAGVRSLHARATEPIRLAEFEARGFRILEEVPPIELVIGLEGQFWRPSGRLATPSAAGFRTAPPAAGTARAVWNFELIDNGASTTLTTETRVQCADATARRRFLPYWYLIRPGSGLIRHAMLRAIRNVAEATVLPAR